MLLFELAKPINTNTDRSFRQYRQGRSIRIRYCDATRTRGTDIVTSSSPACTHQFLVDIRWWISSANIGLPSPGAPFTNMV